MTDTSTPSIDDAEVLPSDTTEVQSTTDGEDQPSVFESISGVFQIAKVECLTCSHLIQIDDEALDEADVALKENKCFNEPTCPATAVNVVLGTNVVAAAQAFFNAHVNTDAKTLERLYRKLGRYHHTVQERINAEVRQMIAADYARTVALRELEQLEVAATEGTAKPAAQKRSQPKAKAQAKNT